MSGQYLAVFESAAPEIVEDALADGRENGRRVLVSGFGSFGWSTHTPTSPERAFRSFPEAPSGRYVGTLNNTIR